MNMPEIDSPVVLHDVGLTQLAEEVLVVSDDDQLEVCMGFAFVDDTEYAKLKGS